MRRHEMLLMIVAFGDVIEIFGVELMNSEQFQFGVSGNFLVANQNL